MVSIITLALVGITGFMIYQMWKKSKGPDEAKIKLPYSPDELRLENVMKGGVIHLRGIGDDLDEFDVKIDSKNIYREGEYSWYELEGDKGDSKVWIEYEEDDELEVSIKLKELRLRDIGLKKNDLDKIDDEEEGEFSYNGEKYYYEDSDQAVFYRHGIEENAESFYYWDFENDEGSKYISVEKWSGGEYEVSFSIPIKKSQIEVYSLTN